MLDVGWTEILVIAIVLIVVVGPKDLPQMLRTFGRMVTKMRGMAGEFRQQFDEALREADLDDVRKTISDAQKLNPLNTIRDAVNPLRQAGSEIKADLEKASREVTAAGSSTPVAASEAAPAEPIAVPSEAQKPASAEPVAAAPLKTGAVSKTADAAAKPAKAPRKAASATKDEKPAAKKSAAAKAKPASRKKDKA
jgi:sec-independent protein translocase protein TatB